MGRKLLLLSLALALVLIAAAPATVMAKKWGTPKKPAVTRFTAVMTPNLIDDTVIGETWPVRDTEDTNVWPIIDLVEIEGVPTPTIVGWVVDGRSIYGGVSGDIAGDFTFTYGGVLDTLQSGSIQGIVTIQTGQGTVYLAARGTSEAEVVGVYLFVEVAGWWYSEPVQSSIEGCPVSPCPLWVFFDEIYPADLAGLPDAALEAMYGDVLPPLPKTLSAEFSGTVRVDAGTGAYGEINGLGQFKPAGGNPLTLDVYPNQHVYGIEGSIQLTGYYSERPLRQVLKLDRAKLREWIEKWKEQHGQH